jgi:hypothetical protein
MLGFFLSLSVQNAAQRKLESCKTSSQGKVAIRELEAS